MTHDPSNRKAPRYSCTLNGYLHILCPEATFTPRPVYVTAKDISESGSRLTTQAMTPDYYRLLIREIRHVKLELDLQDQRVLTLKGRLVWVDYSNNVSSLGITFNQLTDNAARDLKALLHDLGVRGIIELVETTRPETVVIPLEVK